jgi:hypothetical protein
MFRSLFGGKKKPKASESSVPTDSIRSAGVGYTVVIAEFFSPIEDAYIVIEQVNKYDSAVGEWRELVGSDGERRVGIEWSYDGDLFIAVNVHGTPMGLDSIGLIEDDLLRMDQQHSLSNSLTYENQRYSYKNSYEAEYFKDSSGEGDGFYLWEFVSEDSKNIVSVVKWEDAPFEVYTSVVVSPEQVSAYKV